MGEKIIYDHMMEKVWYNFLKSIPMTKYNIYIHQKIPTKLQYFEKYKIPITIETTYGGIEITLAHNLLMYYGLQDPENQHFFLLTGNCIPLKPFDSILLDKKSYFNLFDPKKESWYPRGNNALKYFSKKVISKANTNSVIYRDHAELIIQYDNIGKIETIKDWLSNTRCKEIIEWFQIELSADEFVHLTLLRHWNKDNELNITIYKSYSGAIIFAPWNDMDDYLIFKSKKPNCFTYEDIDMNELQYLFDSPCIIGRKFLRTCTVNNKPLDVVMDQLYSKKPKNIIASKYRFKFDNLFKKFHENINKYKKKRLIITLILVCCLTINKILGIIGLLILLAVDSIRYPSYLSRKR